MNQTPPQGPQDATGAPQTDPQAPPRKRMMRGSATPTGTPTGEATQSTQPTPGDATTTHHTSQPTPGNKTDRSPDHTAHPANTEPNPFDIPNPPAITPRTDTPTGTINDTEVTPSKAQTNPKQVHPEAPTATADHPKHPETQTEQTATDRSEDREEQPNTTPEIDPKKARWTAPGKPTPSNKKKRRTAAVGGKWFTDLDAAYLETITAHGWLTVRDLMDLYSVTEMAIRRRLQALVQYGFLDDKMHAPGSKEILFAPTMRGMKQVGMWDGYKRRSPKTSTYDHNTGLTALSRLLTRHPNFGQPVTEYELIAAAKTGKLSPRIQRIAPWATQHDGTYNDWQPPAIDTQGATGFGEYKRPDMLILDPGLAPIPVELELTVKANRNDYIRTLRTYESAIDRGVFRNTLLYVLAEALPKSHNDEIRKALEWAQKQIGSTVSIAIAELPTTLWKPLAARSGWVTGE